MMFVLGKGISMDVQDLRFAVFDQDQSPESRAYIQNIAGSRYFIQQKPIHSTAETACSTSPWSTINTKTR
jgi:ribosome-dependent ATPase